MVGAVPPILARVRASPVDATTTELLVGYEVLGTAGKMYYALSESEAAAKGGKVTQQWQTAKKRVLSPVQFDIESEPCRRWMGVLALHNVFRGRRISRPVCCFERTSSGFLSE